MLPEVDLYLRKSKVVRNADPRDLLSVESQEERGRAWAERHGYRVRHVWVDNLSAWSDIVRPQFDGALSAVLSGEVPALWCAFLDRFSRKGVEDIVPILGKARVVFDYEGLDSSSDRDRRWIIDRAEQAREYSSRLSYNVRSTKSVQKNRGGWLIGPPYGFEIADTHTRKLRNSDKWPVILDLFRAVASGVSVRGWCRAMNSTRDPELSPRGGQWSVSTASAILHNPVYEGWQVTHVRGVGSIAYRDASGERVSVLAPDADPVPPELVTRARAALQSQPAAFSGGSRAGHLLSGRGILRCAGCGASMPCGRAYVCGTHHSGKMCPAPASVAASALDSYVKGRLQSRLAAADPEDPVLPAIAARYAALSAPKESGEAQEATLALRSAQEGVQRLVDQMAAGMFDPPFDAHLPGLQAEARAALSAAQERMDALRPVKVDISWLLDPEKFGAAWERASLARRQEIVGLAIRKIIVVQASAKGGRFDGDSRVAIEWHGV